MRNRFARDLVLLHAPALFDFRTRETFLGPMADAVRSTAMFEMYPVGLTSIAAFLEGNHYNVEIVGRTRPSSAPSIARSRTAVARST